MAASASPRRGHVDFGRLVVVTFASVLLGSDAVALSRAGKITNLHWAGILLTGFFYALIIWYYLRRRPAIATARSATAHLAAVLATLAPFGLPLLGGHPPGAGRQLAADLLLVTGTGWALWSVRYLGRSLSVLAQARELVSTGPYRWIRHPLYTGEIVSALGLTVASGTAAAAGLWIVLVALQAYRAAAEERLLAVTLPRYRDYQRRTGAIVPRIR